MKKIAMLIVLALALAALGAAQAEDMLVIEWSTPTPDPTPIPTPEPTSTPEPTPTPYAFRDATIEAAIRKALHKGEGQPVTAAELSELKALTVSNAGVVDISDLQYCAGLRTLTLRNNEISDLSPLAGLTGLEYLDLAVNPIGDIGALSGLENLGELWLSDAEIMDVSPLSGLKRLGMLGLGDNQIADVSPLSGLTELTLLNLRNNRITDPAPLASLTNLAYLDLNGNDGIADTSALFALGKLAQYVGPAIRPSAKPMPALKRGDSGEDVETLQIALIEHNYLGDKADGDFGGKTEKALKQVQADAGFELTGALDDATWQYLQDHDAEFTPGRKPDMLMYALRFDANTQVMRAFVKNTGNSEIAELEFRGDQCNEAKRVIGSFFGGRNSSRYIYWSVFNRTVSMQPGDHFGVEIDFSGIELTTVTDGEADGFFYYEDGHFAKISLIGFTTADGKAHKVNQAMYCRFR